MSDEAKKVGFLRFDPDSGRWVLHGRDLHCGDCFQIQDLDRGEWIDVRIEHCQSTGWYLVGGQQLVEGRLARF